MSILGAGIFKGMAVTLKNFVGSYFDKDRLTTIVQQHGKVAAVISDGGCIAKLLAFLFGIFAGGLRKFIIGTPGIIVGGEPILVKIGTHKIL